MRRYWDPAEARGARGRSERVVAVGVFDGLHRGHQRLLRELISWARETGRESAVVTFDRHPQAVLHGEGPLPILSLEHRLLLLERYGVDATLVLRFDRELAAWPPERFIAEILREALGARGLLMGFDTAFGKERKGDYAYLKEREGRLEIEIRRAGVEALRGVRVSSTLVRQAIAAGDLDGLRELLNRPFSTIGEVVKGEGLGRKLGAPTANLKLPRLIMPPRGVYFADVLILGRRAADGSFPCAPQPKRESLLPAVLNLGRRPTVSGDRAREDAAFDPARDRLEVHLLDYEGSLYGDWLEVCFLARRRGEEKLPSLEALKRRIAEDIEARRRFG